MSNNLEKIVLIVSTGRQDIKLWAKGIDTAGQEKDFIVPIGDQVREFHRRMRENSSEFYIIDDRTPERIAATRDGSLDYDGNQIKSQGEKSFKFGKGVIIKQPIPLRGPNPPYVVHPAKVANLIAELKRLTESGEIDLQGVLIFATERNTGERFDAGEPIATGNVLGQWIATKFDKLTYVGEKEPRFDFKPYEVC